MHVCIFLCRGFMLNTVKTDQTSGGKKRKCFEYFIINTYLVIDGKQGRFENMSIIIQMIIIYNRNMFYYTNKHLLTSFK